MKKTPPSKYDLNYVEVKEIWISLNTDGLFLFTSTVSIINSVSQNISTFPQKKIVPEKSPPTKIESFLIIIFDINEILETVFGKL